MDPVLRSLLDDRLDASGLSAEAAALVRDVAGPGVAAGPGAPPIWLRSVTVEGFRGIGPAATLELEPRPGLTVVAGRNGSGKSSFAEGLELLLTGSLRRWARRPKAWTETWQSLHFEGPTRISASFVPEGTGEEVALAHEWAHGAAFDAGRASHGWMGELEAFRPFLAYAELATMFDTLTSLYDALTPVLGLADLDEVQAELGRRRLALDNHRKAVKGVEDALLARLDADPEDARALAVAAAIRARKRDLPALAALLETPPAEEDAAELRRLGHVSLPSDEEVAEAFSAVRDAEAALAEAASTDAQRATALAALLRQALGLRDPSGTCPVCGTADILDGEWAEHAAREAADLDAQAAALPKPP